MLLIECQCPYGAAELRKPFDLSWTGKGPHSQSRIVCARQQESTASGESRSANLIQMTPEGRRDFLARSHMPPPQGGRAGGSDQRAAIRRNIETSPAGA